MSVERVPVTTRGYESWTKRLKYLKEVERPENVKDIERAREHGDISENAEFTSAIEERDNLVRKAEQVQEDLEKVKIIDESNLRPGKVGMGSHIRVRNLETSAELVYSMLGPWDGTPEEGVLNYRSPLGQFFLGRSEGDEVSVELPSGTVDYKILSSGSRSE